MATCAVWVWVDGDRTLDPVRAARFAREQGVREAWVSVPWTSPDASVLAMAAALRAAEVAVAALGGSTDWGRAPRPRRRLGGSGRCGGPARQRRDREQCGGRPAAAPGTHATGGVLRRRPRCRGGDADGLPHHQRRDPGVRRTPGPLQHLGRSYRLAGDTLPSADPDTTFAARPAAYLRQETARVRAALSGDQRFAAIAVHDLRGWRDLPA